MRTFILPSSAAIHPKSVCSDYDFNGGEIFFYNVVLRRS
jgi:hypothetical protein